MTYRPFPAAAEAAAATRLPPAVVKAEAHSPIQPVDYAGAYAAVMSRVSEAHAYLSQGDTDRAYVLLTQAMAVRRRVEMRAIICDATPYEAKDKT
jgi:hypothetical protein